MVKELCIMKLHDKALLFRLVTESSENPSVCSALIHVVLRYFLSNSIANDIKNCKYFFTVKISLPLGFSQIP